MRDNTMKKPTLTSILSEHAREQEAIAQQERKDKIAQLPEGLQSVFNDFRDKALSNLNSKTNVTQLKTNNVIQVKFGGPRFYIPKTVAASKSFNTIENWYNKSHLYFDGLSIQLDIDGDYIEVIIKIDEPENASSEFEDYLTAKVGSSFKFALFDGEIQLAEFTGNVVGKGISGSGSIIQHEKVASGEDGLNLHFEE